MSEKVTIFTETLVKSEINSPFFSPTLVKSMKKYEKVTIFTETLVKSMKNWQFFLKLELKMPNNCNFFLIFVPNIKK